MRVLFAGAKPQTKAHPWDDPCIAAEKEIDIMITYFEFQQKTIGKRKRIYLRNLAKRKANK